MALEITEKRLKELERAESKLSALENGGVDNWEWYDESLKEWNAENQEAELVVECLDEIAEVFAQAAYEPSETGAGWAINESGLQEAEKLLLKLIKDAKEIR